MTIQEYKGHLDHYMSVLEDAGATADELYVARCTASYAYNLINNHMIEGNFNVDISKLEDGKCYATGHQIGIIHWRQSIQLAISVYKVLCHQCAACIMIAVLL